MNFYENEGVVAEQKRRLECGGKSVERDEFMRFVM